MPFYRNIFFFVELKTAGGKAGLQAATRNQAAHFQKG